MYQQSYTDYIKENPNSEFSKFLIRFFSAKPDFTELDRKSKECEEQLYAEQMADIERRLAEKKKQNKAEA